MKAIITHEQLYMSFTPEIKAFLGWDDERLINAGFEGGNICLNDCLIGEIEDNGNNTYTVGLSLANINKLPRRVAYNEVNEEQVNFWISLVGEENIIL